jgi:subtilase family serine protease
MKPVLGTKSGRRSSARGAGTRRRRMIAGAVAAALPLALFAGYGAASAASSSGRRAVPDSKPSWLTQAKRQGATANSTKVDFGILLSSPDLAAEKALLAKVSDPDSAQYGQYLTRAQFVQKFAPAASDVSAARTWLTSQGFSIRGVLGGGTYLEASGTAKQVAKTFDTSLSSFSYLGHTVRANTTPLTLPSGTPAAISGVLGIDQGSQLKKPANSATTAASTSTSATSTLPGPPEGSRYGVQPCSAYFGQKTATAQPAASGKKQPYAVCGYDPQQYQSAYGESALLKKGVTGKGITVAITDAFAAPTILKDAQTYNAVHKQPAFAKGQFSQILPKTFNVTDPADAQGWYGEETLDVEAVHAMAPGAKVVFVAGADDFTGLDEAWAQTIDSHVADIITNSWSDGVDTVALLGQSYIDYYTQFSLEAALTGQTVSFSTGDDGDQTAGGTDLPSKTVGFPSDSPYVLAAGGSSIAIGKSGQRTAEYGWQNAYSQLADNGTKWHAPVYSSGGGGGQSQIYAQPFYQKGVVPAKVADFYGSPTRVVPDIAMAGDPNTGFEVGETQVFPDGTYWDQYRIGGTSLSSPLLAGVFAVAGQAAGHPLGFVNPLLYKLVGTSAVYDTKAPTKPVDQVRTDYTNFVDNSEGKHYELQHIDVQTSTLKDTKGYDDETGVGTPNGPAFFTALAHGK